MSKFIRFYVISAICLAFSVLPLVAQQGVKFQEGSFEYMLAQARADRLPFLVCFEYEGCGICKKMNDETYRDGEFANYLEGKVTPYKVDAYSDLGIGITQMFQVNQFPTVLIFSPNGDRLGMIKGFFYPNDYKEELDPILLGWENFNAKQAVIAQQTPVAQPAEASVQEAVVPEVLSFPAVQYEDPEQFLAALEEVKRGSEEVESGMSETYVERLELMAGELADQSQEVFLDLKKGNFSFADVPGLQKYSVKDKKPEGYGIRVSTLTSLESLKTELLEYEKRWMSEIWVFSQGKNGSKIYCLVLGQFDDKEQALYMRKLLYTTFFINGTVVKLDDIRY